MRSCAITGLAVESSPVLFSVLPGVIEFSDVTTMAGRVLASFELDRALAIAGN
jgi:hypothetical protein